jgi:hypothetical protein
MKTCVFRRAAEAAPLCGDPLAGPWPLADVIRIDEFPWYKGGLKQATEARVLYDERALYLQFVCEDRHISAEVTQTNGPVSRDSCVEFFATIEPDLRPDYFNIEANCCGTRLMKWGRQREGRKLISPEMAARIPLATSVPGPTKADSPDDHGWWAAIALPFDLLSEFTGVGVAPRPGSRWRANFYRCGGKTDPQHACWNATSDFHGPQFFGEVRFE